MRYFQPYGVNNPDASYENGDSDTGADGSVIPGEAVEFPQREIVNLQIEAGLTPSGTDPRQLLKAVRSGRLWFFDDLGTVGHIVITPPTPHTQLFKGNTFWIWPHFANTGTVDVTVNTLNAYPLLRRDGTALVAGDVTPGIPIQITFNGSGQFLLTSTAPSEIRRAGTVTLYVRQGGDDSHDGSQNADAYAFGSIQGALIYANAKLGGAPIKIVLGGIGTYAGLTNPGYGLTVPPYLGGGGQVIITTAAVEAGNLSQQALYTIVGSLYAASGTTLTITGVTLQNTGSGHLLCTTSATMYLSYVTFAGTSVTSGAAMMVYVPDNAQVRVGPGCVCQVSMPYAFRAIAGGGVTFASVFTMIGNISYSQGFVMVEMCGHVYVVPGASFDVSGASVSGYKALGLTNGVVNTVGQGNNALPGSIAPSMVSGAQYA